VSRWFPERLELWLKPSKAEPLLAAFERELDGRAAAPGTHVTCIVSGEGVRYGVVPWHSDMATPAQRHILAEHCFTEAYGDVARGWTLRQHSAGYGAATLACAIDTPLLDRLAALMQARRLKLSSVQPALMVAFNAVRRRIDPGMFWFVWVDGPWTTLLLMSPGEPLHVKRLASATELTRLIEREWFALGIDAPRCPVYVVRAASAAAAVARQAPSESGWRVVELPALADGAAHLPGMPADSRLQAA